MRSLFENIFLRKQRKVRRLKTVSTSIRLEEERRKKNYKYLEEIMNVLQSISRKCTFISSHSLAGSTCTCELKILS